MADDEDMNLTVVPTNRTGEIALGVGKSLVSLLPVVGGSAAELLGLVLSPVVERRRDAFYGELGRRLLRLEEVRGQLAALADEVGQQRESFTTTALHAIQIALRTHQREKLRALQNAVLNAATGSTPSDDLQLVFLSLIDQFSPWHLRLLEFLDEPAAWMQRHGRPLTPNRSLDGVTLVDYAFPELNVRESSTHVFLDQLATQGLLHDAWNVTSNYTALGTRGASRTSDLGKQFLAFFTSPIPDDDDNDSRSEKVDR